MTPNKKQILSKSKLMRGVQCEKNLWLSIHKPELEAETDEATQMQFDEGNEVGDLARQLEKQGVLIDAPYYDFDSAVKKTAEAIQLGESVIFEASFQFENLFSRADILKKTKSGWHLIEVKKSTGVKDYHIADSAIQAYIIEQSGLRLKSISLRHVNNKMIYPHFDDYFETVDITKEVRTYQKNELQKTLPKLIIVAESPLEPTVEIGPHCEDPFDCPFKAHCWKEVPKHSVFDLPSLAPEKKWILFNSGHKTIASLDEKKFKGLTQKAITATKNKKTEMDAALIQKELSRWKLPFYFFDFETLGPAIPRYEGTKPYSAIPFQFSCHVQKSWTEKKLEHFEYLHTEATDPRPELIKALLHGLGENGSIVAYNKSFEITVIKKLAEFDLKNKKKLLALVDRFVDPLPVLKQAVYHPDFLGSFSIKYVAPALIGKKLQYDNLVISNGSQAQAIADRILQGKMESPDKEKYIEHLLTYCRQDTMAMVELVQWLFNAINTIK